MAATEALPYGHTETVEISVTVGNATARARKDTRGWWVTVDALELPPVCRDTEKDATDAAHRLAAAYDQMLAVIRLKKVSA